MMKFKNKIRTITTSILALFIVGLFNTSVQAQKKNKMRGDKKHDASTVENKMDNMQIEIYSIMEEYPEMDYHYLYDNGTMVGVEITGIPDAEERKKLEELLVTLKDFQGEVTEFVEVSEVYYVSETEPKPTIGYDDFYDKLYNNLYYPEESKEAGVEGTIYVKFVIDEYGNISRVKTKTNIDDPERLVDPLRKEAADAVRATSGDWIPAKIGGEPVSRWMMVPVEFKLETPPGMMRLYPFSDDS